MPDIKHFYSELTETFTAVKQNELLSRHTTFRIGGPAQLFVTATKAAELESAIRSSRRFDVPFFVLGWGSNVIFSDAGFAGLVIQNRCQNWQIVARGSSPTPSQTKIGNRFETVGDDYYTVEGLDYSDDHEPPVIVRVESGAKVGPLMNALFHEGITGLQWYAGIPATVGGAIYMNMHGGAHFFGDLVERAVLLSDASIKEVDRQYFEFDYDWSLLHETKEIVLRADLKLRRGDVARAKQLAREWAARKSLQPQISAGCIFRNLTQEEQERLDLPTPSIGYLIEHVLNLKGVKEGGAVISPRHAAFIENLGHTKAADVIKLIERIREKAKALLDLDLKLEVEIVPTMLS